MDLLTLIGTIFRRWYVTVPILLAALGAAASVQSTIPPEYEANGSVLLEEPRFDPARLPGTFVNANAIVALLDDAEAAGAGIIAGGTQVVSRAPDGGTVEITGVGADRNDVVTTIENAVDWVVNEVATIQEVRNIVEAERLEARILTPLIEAEEREDGNFRATGTVLLEDPAAGMNNPYSAGEGTSSLIRTIANSDAGQTRVLQETGPNVAGFNLGGSGSNASIIRIATYGADPAATIAAFDTVRDVLAEELDARQARADVPTSRRIVITDLAPPQLVRDVSPPLSRAVAAIVAAGGLLALGSAVALDGVLAGRRREAEYAADPNIPSWWFDTSDLNRSDQPQDRAEPEAAASGLDEKH